MKYMPKSMSGMHMIKNTLKLYSVLFDDAISALI